MKLSRGEFDLLTVAKHLSAPKVYNDRAKAKRVERLRCARRGPAAPQQRFQPRQQLERLEWFAKIVIRAQLQAQDFVDYLATRSQHQNRRRDTSLPQIAAHIKAVFARQHDVQNDHVEVAFAGARQTRQAIGGRLNAIVFRVEQVRQGHRDARVVFNQQDLVCHRRCKKRGPVRSRYNPRASRACVKTLVTLKALANFSPGLGSGNPGNIHSFSKAQL